MDESKDSVLEIRPIQYNGPEFAEWLQLRQQILRTPLGLSYSEADIAAEHADHHLCVFDSKSGAIVAGLILAKQNQAGEEVVYKMRQVAVGGRLQNQGIGTRLVAFAEEFCWSNNADKIILHARQSAVDFYLKLNYTITSEQFEEVGLPHFQMQKCRD